MDKGKIKTEIHIKKIGFILRWEQSTTRRTDFSSCATAWEDMPPVRLPVPLYARR